MISITIKGWLETRGDVDIGGRIRGLRIRRDPYFIISVKRQDGGDNIDLGPVSTGWFMLLHDLTTYSKEHRFSGEGGLMNERIAIAFLKVDSTQIDWPSFKHLTFWEMTRFFAFFNYGVELARNLVVKGVVLSEIDRVALIWMAAARWLFLDTTKELSPKAVEEEIKEVCSLKAYLRNLDQIASTATMNRHRAEKVRAWCLSVAKLISPESGISKNFSNEIYNKCKSLKKIWTTNIETIRSRREDYRGLKTVWDDGFKIEEELLTTKNASESK